MTRHLAPLLTLFALGGCGEEPAVAPLPGELLITQLYTSGAAPAGGTDHYYSDQFFELGNNSKHPLDLSGVRFADVYGAAGAINPGMEPDSFATSHPELVVLSSVWRLPDGTRLEPGHTLTVAHDGANHRPFSTIDLSGADFETFVADSEREEDSPTVANVESVVYNGGYDWLITVFGPSLVVLDADTPLGDAPQGAGNRYVSIPVSAVLDGVDTVMDADSGSFKRLPPAIDAGFTTVGATYIGTALHRATTDDGWVDTDDSGADFSVGAPAPTTNADSDGVFGEPSVVLGTGTDRYEPLDDGDTVELIAGIQGGWHVDVSLWFDGFGPGGTTLRYEALDSSATALSFPTQTVLAETSVLDAETGWHRVGDRVVMDISDPSEVVGQTVILRATAELDGQTWSDERTVTVVDDAP